MRFKANSNPAGYTVYAVSGVHSVSFAVDPGKADTHGLLGFSVERLDHAGDEKYFMAAFKVFPEVCPHPTPHLNVTTRDHPVQSLVWDDFTAKPGHKYEYLFYPVKGKPKKLNHLSPIRINVEMEPEHDLAKPHDVFFNRGVASSQAYERKFQNVSPDDPSLTPQQRQDRLTWLGRGLDQAILEFIAQAKRGDALRACFYEFRYAPVAEALKKAIDLGVDVKIIMDSKLNLQKPELCPSHGSCTRLGGTANFGTLLKNKQRHDKVATAEQQGECFPRCANLQTVCAARIPDANLILREANQDCIAHNKFIVWIKKGTAPTAVWTGSTNISEGGIFGQTNVGHWVRSETVAEKYLQYWKVLSADPGVRAGQTGRSGPGKVALRSFKHDVTECQKDLTLDAGPDSIPLGTTSIFSPRDSAEMLTTYAQLLESSKSVGCITLAFGVSDVFKQLLQENTAKSPIIFMLLEKRDQKNVRSTKPFVALSAKNNVYEAFGSYLHGKALYQWARETNTQFLKLNGHVKYVHSKFLLRDPLGDDPIVVTGSANFSTNSTTANDENMIVIRGDTRAADIYFTEFMRIFNHYYFRAVQELTAKRGEAESVTEANLFLKNNDQWLKQYKPGSLKAKRLAMFVNMKGCQEQRAQPL